MKTSELPKYIREMLEKDKDYYSLHNMDNILRAKEDSGYLGDVILANENLIWYSIHKYVGKPEVIARNNGIDKDDIFQLGRLGFIKAINAFDVNRKVKFSSFAAPAIMREVRCFIRDSGNIIKLSRKATSVLRGISKLKNDLGYSPSIEEASELLDVDSNKIIKALCIGQSVKYLDEPVTSSHFSINNSPEYSFEIEDTSCIPEDIVVEGMFIKDLMGFLRRNLNTLEKTILARQLQGATQAQTAHENGISIMKVGRTLRKIVDLIKLYISQT